MRCLLALLTAGALALASTESSRPVHGPPSALSCGLLSNQPPEAKRPAAKYEVSGPEKSRDGLHTYVLTSDYQARPCKVYVLLPDRFEPKTKYKVLYILPAWTPSKEGILEAKKLNLHNQHNLICVVMDFSTMPWYADHPDNPKMRYDSYLPDIIIPFIDTTFPTLAAPSGRILIGFSKSGLGAVTLLLRHPEVFGRAGSWDGILIMDNRPEFFGPRAHYLENYYVPNLLARRAALLKGQPARLAIVGYGIRSFEKLTEDTHKLLDKHGIPHYYENGTQRKHEWGSGWFAPLVQVLMADDMAKVLPGRP
jgi:enterochelin esterase-like enzyme